MTRKFNYNRRQFLCNSGVLGMSLAAGGIAAPLIARAGAPRIRIASNPGLENATLNALMLQQSYFGQFGVDAQIVETHGASGPFDAIVAGKADVCMVSGYNRVLSRIEQGARVKIVGAGKKKTSLTVYAGNNGIKTLSDLEGKSVAVGAPLGLLHALMLQLLKEKGIDASTVNFVNKGSNADCYRAVVNGEADACCSSVSHVNDKDGVVKVDEGDMWSALPEYVFQTAYASESAIRDNHDGLVRVMAAYGALYRYLMSPAAHDAFFDARKRAQKRFDRGSAQAVWDFIQVQQPYSTDLSLTDRDIGYRQDMYIGLGSLNRKQSIGAVADMSASIAAAKLLA
ncbi:ABC transporter substrate-binding protein [Marinobacter bohaiensis]|uniref:ABC transporter substrate-binding protein n=1 Tax=Marinobacter bohaiensis TaxID=2201898 RepID=UPI000DABE2BE|nr:ABC transporter substrate-binding protein [Marinobacter bohaiensis]